MVIDHVGIVVRSLERGAEDWERLFGYRRATEVVVNTRQKVKVLFLEKQGSLQVKLIEPSDATSPIQAMAQRGGGLHHLCFRCASLPAELARLQAGGIRILSPPQPGEAFENDAIAFVYAGNGLNVELIDTLRRAARLPP